MSHILYYVNLPRVGAYKKTDGGGLCSPYHPTVYISLSRGAIFVELKVDKG